MMMRDETKEKREAIAALKETYYRTRMPPDVARRIEAALFEPTPERRPYRRALIPAWGVMTLVAVVLILGAFVAYRQPPFGHGAWEAQVLSVKGAAYLTQGDSRRPLSPATAIAAGALLETGDDGRVEWAFGPHRATLGAKAKVRILSHEMNDMGLRLSLGRVGLSVSPLSSSQHLRVETAHVTVEVVGTLFSVEERPRCTTVAVQRGRVRTTTTSGHRVEILGQGEERRFCSDEAAEASDATPEPLPEMLPVPGAENVQPADAKSPATSAIPSVERAIRSHFTDDQATPAEAAATAAVYPDEQAAAPLQASLAADTEVESHPFAETGAATAEERLYAEAHTEAVRGDPVKADALLKAYLDTYPGGDFAEEALFRRVRINYRTKRPTEVCALGEMFLSRFEKSEYRTAEVRILCAESLLSSGKESRGALELLLPLIHDLDRLSERHRHQVICLQFTAAGRDGNRELCRKWSQSYLEDYPKGRFAGEEKKISVYQVGRDQSA